MKISTTLPIKMTQAQEILDICEFYHTITCGLAIRYHSPLTVKIEIPKLTEHVKETLSGAGWALAFENGVWIAQRDVRGDKQ